MKAILNKSYEITFLMLICITILVYIRSLNEKVDKKELSLQLAGFVTSIAAFHYYYMINTGSVVIYRYFDWLFTTPILLFDLFLILDIVDFTFFVKVGMLNTIMLLFGYLGELQLMSMINSTILGFIPFIFMFYLIKQKMDEHTQQTELTIFYIFAGLWALYGFNHLVTNIELKNISYNVLDLLTKGMFALYIYYRTWNF